MTVQAVSQNQFQVSCSLRLHGRSSSYHGYSKVYINISLNDKISLLVALLLRISSVIRAS